ncbi:MAG: pyridoxamine 5'-phosphate oxidase family protein [Bacteroidales bacterium]
MRKKEKQITDTAEMYEILQKGIICRLAFHDDPFPYILPFNYGFHDDCIYIHSAREGKKIELIKKNNRIGFEITTGTEIVKATKPCGWTTKYKSVCGNGYAEILTSTPDKKKGLDIIMKQHGSKIGDEYNVTSLSDMLIIKVRIDQMTGKKS